MFCGREMICPRCKVYHDILAYVPMIQIDEYADLTNWICKCPACKFLFSPKVADPILIDIRPAPERWRNG